MVEVFTQETHPKSGPKKISRRKIFTEFILPIDFMMGLKGTSSLEVYDGRIMADVGDVVIVSMNYRYEYFMAS